MQGGEEEVLLIYLFGGYHRYQDQTTKMPDSSDIVRIIETVEAHKAAVP